MSTTPLLSIKNLTLASGKDHQNILVNNLSLTIAAGQCIGLVGESGSGKSLTTLSIMQLLPTAVQASQTSQILFNGTNLLDLSEKSMRAIRGNEIAMIFQDATTALNPVFTIGQQLLEIYQQHTHLPRHQQILEAKNLLIEVGLAQVEQIFHSYPHQLSGGQRQRAMIAMALVLRPKLLLLDEPTTALDVSLQAQILQLLKQLQQKYQMAMLFISHDLAIIAQLADEITVLKKGITVEQAKTKTLFTTPQQDYTRLLIQAIPDLTKTKSERSPSITNLVSIKNLLVTLAKPKKLFKKHGAQVILNEVNFDLPKGQTTALVGESGSGKTTTAKTLMGLIKPKQGSIEFNQVELLKISSSDWRKQRKNMQMIFQDPTSALNPRMMIYESLQEACALQKTAPTPTELLQQVGLPTDYLWRYPHELSGGEKQRVCIARALAFSPALLILDEPTSALDVVSQQHILQLLKTLQMTTGITYLLITHQLSIVAELADQMVVMQQGKIVEQGIARQVLLSPQHSYTKKLLAAAPTIQS